MGKLKEGDTAPDFSAVDENGNPVSLSDYKGKKLILYFYPKDNTPGCTAEACSLRDGYGELRSMGFELLGVSPDSAASHVRFKEKHGLPFRLIVDEGNRIAESYGVWGKKKFMGKTYQGILRTTFVINDGRIEKVFDKVKTKEHSAQIIDSYK